MEAKLKALPAEVKKELKELLSEGKISECSALFYKHRLSTCNGCQGLHDTRIWLEYAVKHDWI